MPKNGEGVKYINPIFYALSQEAMITLSIAVKLENLG